MDDLTILRQCKRKQDPKLNLSGRDITILSQDVFQLTHLEVLDLSNNKISSLDAKISNLTNLKFLDLSNNQLKTLPNALLKLENLQVLNVSNNPLNLQFEPLLKKENQSDPKLKSTLKACFDNSFTLDSSFPTFDLGSQLKSERPFTTNPTFQKKPNWLDEKEEPEEPVKFLSTKSKESNSNSLDLQKQLSETENLLSKEQLKVIQLTKELEEMKKSYSNDTFTLKSNFSKSPFNIDESLTKYLEIDYKELDIGDNISQGGFSLVDQGIFRGTPVAIKRIFNPNITTELMDEISNEIEMLNKLRHPNIVLLMGICSKPPNLCIITELLPNGSLYNLLHLSKMDIKPQMKLEMARDIALTLNFLHLSQIVHRDIKSHNVLLDEKFKVKLCDFGLARNEKELNKGSMKFGGTPAYMAPEIFQKRSYDKKIDVFAFGTLLWELFARKVPYEGLEPSDVMQKVLGEDQLSMSGIPKRVATLINECRATDPKKRPDFKYVVEVLGEISVL